MILKNKLRMILPMAGLFIISGCSSDDDGDSRDCDSCTLLGEKLEICDNGNDTYTLTYEGESETITEAELGGVSPEEFVEAICVLGNLEF